LSIIFFSTVKTNTASIFKQNHPILFLLSKVTMPNEFEVKPEVKAAAEWFVQQLVSKQGLGQDLIAKFQLALQHAVESKYAGHWYEAQPWRGNAFRSIAFDRRTNHLDEGVLKAAEDVGFIDFISRIMPIYASFTIWVDPGEVTVRYSTGASHETTLTVYSRNNSSTAGGSPVVQPQQITSLSSSASSTPTYTPTPNMYLPPGFNSSTSPYSSPKPTTKYVRYFPGSGSPYSETTDSFRGFLRNSKLELSSFA
jgi:hypothetical protein